jgi:hypothetical protein
MKIEFNETCDKFMTVNQFSINLPTELLLRKTICAMWQIFFQELCMF